jgi:hypothetical protein
VLLDLHYYGAVSFNLHQAAVAINAVDSERTDIVSHLNILNCFALTDEFLGLSISSSRECLTATNGKILS